MKISCHHINKLVHLHGSKCQTVFNKEMFIQQEESEEMINGQVRKSSFNFKQIQRICKKKKIAK
jgi:hypothetical protein